MRWLIAGPTASALVLALAGSAGAGILPSPADSSDLAGIGALRADPADGAVTELGILVFDDAASVTGPIVTGEPIVIDAPGNVPGNPTESSLSGRVRVPLAAGPSSLAATGLPPSPDPSLSFEGIGYTGWIPPDTQGAVGLVHLMVVTNGAVRVMNRTGGVVSSVSINDFWGLTSDFVFDPRVLYDALAGRWIVTAAANNESPQSSVLLAVSASSDPTGAWFRWVVDADAADLLWADQPKVGFSGRWLVMTAVMFPNIGGPAARPLVVAFDKADLYTGSSASIVRWPGLDPSTWGFSLAPAETLDASADDLYLLTTWTGGSLQLAKVSGPVGVAALSVVGLVASPERWASGPPTNPPNLAPQLGTTATIHAGDDRVQNLVFRNGSLWAAHTIFLPENSATRASVQWWNIDTDASVIQRGRIDDPSATFMYAYPSIGANSADDVLVGFTRFSASEHPSAGLAFRFGTDPLSLMRDETIYKAGQATYLFTDTRGRNRWGDYSATVVDPLNDVDLWTIQEVTSTTPDEWSIWWARVEVSALDREPPVWAQGASLSDSDVGPDSLTVSWPSASDNVGVTGYRVFMDGVLIDELPESTRTRVFTGLTQATTYAFVVQARDAIGNWSSDLSGSFDAATDFLDDNGSTFEPDNIWLSGIRVTRGCNPPDNDLFCPDDDVTRAQVATFLVRALGLTPSDDDGAFTDHLTSVHRTNINALRIAGITRGCNPPANDQFCPFGKVTRGAMAAFLVRALGYTDDGGGNLFTDDDGSIFESDIDRLGAAGVTKGCNPPINDRFCPTIAVTRGEMAAFLHRALG